MSLLGLERDYALEFIRTKLRAIPVFYTGAVCSERFLRNWIWVVGIEFRNPLVANICLAMG